MMEDPEKHDEFVKQMQNMLHDEEMDKYFETLTTEQIDGYYMYLKMKRDQRYKITKLL